jgi:large subunit ribosomal protein L6
MSRIGKLPIPLPTGVDLSVSDGMITVKGPKGTLQQAVVGLVSIDREGDDVVVRRVDDSRPARANHGLMRALVANMVTGVTAGFTKRLDVIGVGYRSEVKGRELVMQLGYSHPVVFPIPQGIDVEVDKSGKITVSGTDKQAVGQVAAVIRGFRSPDHYKGKGVRYENERVLIKQGKTA